MKAPKFLLTLVPFLIVFAILAIKVSAAESVFPVIYSGAIHAVKFNKDGSFFIRLNLTDKNTTIYDSFCENKANYLVHETHPYINSVVLKRMGHDVRKAFFSNNKPTISLSVSGCTKEKGYPIVSNIMLGVWTED